jgi:hypothetical protein
LAYSARAIVYRLGNWSQITHADWQIPPRLYTDWVIGYKSPTLEPLENTKKILGVGGGWTYPQRQEKYNTIFNVYETALNRAIMKICV